MVSRETASFVLFHRETIGLTTLAYRYPHGQAVVQRQVNAVAYELGYVSDRGVDISRRDEHPGGVG